MKQKIWHPRLSRTEAYDGGACLSLTQNNIEQFLSMLLKSGESASLVNAHQATIADYIGCHYDGQLLFHRRLEVTDATVC
jgi:hypothetical protein